RQFQQADLVFQVTEALQASGLPADCLDLEITESNAMQNAELSISALWDLKNLGVRLSMDDFGTGYSSLNYLRRFPIDRIKIDQSFVRDVNRNPDDAATAAAASARAHPVRRPGGGGGGEAEERLLSRRGRRGEEMRVSLSPPPVPAAKFQEFLDSKKTLGSRKRKPAAEGRQLKLS